MGGCCGPVIAQSLGSAASGADDGLENETGIYRQQQGVSTPAVLGAGFKRLDTFKIHPCNEEK